MNQTKRRRTIVLAVAPSVYGFGFALFDSPQHVLDWGMRYVREDKNRKCLARIEALIDWCQPDVLVLEDATGVGSLRRPRIRRLIRSINRLASRRGITTSSYSRSQVLSCFAPFNVRTKHQIATQIGAWLPDLTIWVPPKRKPWLPEHHRMAVFSAVSLAITHFEEMGRRRRGRKRKSA